MQATYEESPVGSRAPHSHAPAAASMASFAVRLMSLDPYELSCLNSDNELMQHLNETQLLMESRLQNIHANKLSSAPNGINNSNNFANQTTPSLRQDKYFMHLHHHHQQQQQQQQLQQSQLQQQNNHLINQYQQQQQSAPANLNFRHNHHVTPSSHQLQQQQQLQANQLLLAPISQYESYCARQLAALAQQTPMDPSQVQQQQQALLIAAQHQQHDQNRLKTQLQALIAASQHQQQQLHINNTFTSTTSSISNGFHHNNQPTSNLDPCNSTNPLAPTNLSPQQQEQQQQQLQMLKQQSNVQPALDLRTTPSRPMSALSASSSPLGRACSTGSGKSSASSSGTRQHPKKVKLSEYKKMQQVTEMCSTNGDAPSTIALASNHQNNISARNGSQNCPSRLDCSAPSPIVAPSNSLQTTSSSDDMDVCDHSNFSDQNRWPDGKSASSTNLQKNNTNNHKSKQVNTSYSLNQLNNNTDTKLSKSPATATKTTSGKKYKGEFDEPTPVEVAQRERELDRPSHYHRQALEKGECACVLGSEFRDKTSNDVLLMIEQWRSMDVELRTKWKWDVNDLPKDIPLSHIKKFEDLRREFSDGRADFGGASKRKPLGIRGTRQFLLILYCLWGHPGRDDPMQRDGYCPHCFAKIKKANEQSTLVRVVNHFNMKHKIGANPRLSPQLESSASSTQSTSVNDELIRQQQTQKRGDVAHVIGDEAPDNQEQQKQQQQPSAAPSEFSLPPSPVSTTNCSGLVRETLLSVIEAAISKLDSPKSIPPVDDCDNKPQAPKQD